LPTELNAATPGCSGSTVRKIFSVIIFMSALVLATGPGSIQVIATVTKDKNALS
jgi:hypothetical protein